MTKVEILQALMAEAEAQGTFTQLSKKTGIPRTHLYAVFDGNPTINTILKVCSALNVHMVVLKG